MKHSLMKCARWQLQWRIRLICVSAVMLFFVLPAHAQTDAILPPIGGPGGGFFVARCPERQYLTGFELRTGDDVDAIKPICVTAYGPAGNTATGPGSLKIRDALSAAGQRGSNASVKLHLSRNYKP